MQSFHLCSSPLVHWPPRSLISRRTYNNCHHHKGFGTPACLAVVQAWVPATSSGHSHLLAGHQVAMEGCQLQCPAKPRPAIRGTGQGHQQVWQALCLAACTEISVEPE